MPLWVDIVVKLTPALVTLVVGGIAATIAFRQFRIAKDKLRLDLFGKRLEAYEKLQEFFTAIMREGCVKDEMLPILAEARYKSRFIFGSEIEAKFDIWWKKAVEMRTLRVQMYGPDALPVGPKRTAICQREHDAILWMMDEMKSCSELYSKYLHFS